MDDHFANNLYQCMEKIYAKLPKNGKPAKVGEFTVLAAFVAAIKSSTSPNSVSFEVLSLATGTKCASEDDLDAHGVVLHDSHAEVLARRGLVRYLADSWQRLQHDSSYATNPLCPLDEQGRWKQNQWEIFLCISDAPCGDASIYADADGEMTFTGAKLVTTHDPSTSSATASTTTSINNGIVRETGTQQVGVLRRKCGRSDIAHHSQCKSCSDKLCRWHHLGLQGSQLYSLIGHVPLIGVVVAADPGAQSVEVQLNAMRRALVSRTEELLLSASHSPSTFVRRPLQIHVYRATSSSVFDHSKSIIKHRFAASRTNSTSAAVSNVSKGITEDIDSQKTLDASTQSISPTKKRKIDEITNQDNTLSERPSVVCLPCSFSINWQRLVPPCVPSKSTGAVSVRPDASQPSTASAVAGISVAGKKKARVLPIVAGGSVEVCVAQSGLLQGATAKDRHNVLRADTIASRLSRRQMYALLSTLKQGNTDEHAADTISNQVSMSTTCDEKAIDSELVSASMQGTEDSIDSVSFEEHYRTWKVHNRNATYTSKRQEFFELPIFSTWHAHV